MKGSPTILVLHGLSMCGASMLRTLGPVARELELLGFELLAPNGAHGLSAGELASLQQWFAECYAKRGQDHRDWFREGRFWNAGEHHDWFQSETDAKTNKKTYRALECSLDGVADAIRGRGVVGVLGFSQGAAMAMVIAARALQGDVRFAGLRFGIFLSGFKPVFDEPAGVQYPIVGQFPALFGIGEHDPIFPGTAEYLGTLSQAFAAGAQEQRVFAELGHDVPSRPQDVERVAAFVASQSAPR